jgi:nucleoside-diphosphate-sugar epimerase
MSPRSLVTGGAGFLSSHVVDRQIAHGDTVMRLDDFSTGRRESRLGRGICSFAVAFDRS